MPLNNKIMCIEEVLEEENENSKSKSSDEGEKAGDYEEYHEKAHNNGRSKKIN